MGVQGRSSFFQLTAVIMAEAKQFKTYEQQLDLLEERGMVVEDPASAQELLRRLTYYRLSGYWHPMHQFDSETGMNLDEFRPGTSFELVRDLYIFDEQLRNVIAAELLSHLYKMSPGRSRNPVANACGLSAPQLESWLRSLNVLRNYSAHHARVFNRVFDIKPKLSDDPRLSVVKGQENRAFTQLTLIQYLHRELGLSPAAKLPALLKEFPDNNLVPFSRIGAPADWELSELWAVD